MGRRFGIGADAAFTGVVVAAVLTLWEGRGTEFSWATVSLGLAAPSIAALGVMLVAFLSPNLINHTHLQRPLTFLLPAIHSSLTVLSAKLILTGPSAVRAIPEPLSGVACWLSPLMVLALGGLSWIALELTHWRRRTD